MKNLSTLSLALIFTTDLISISPELQFKAEIAYSITQLGLDTPEVINKVNHTPDVLGISEIIFKGEPLEPHDIFGRLQFIAHFEEQGIIIQKQMDNAAMNWGKENIDNKQVMDAYIKLQYQIPGFPFDHYMGPKTYEETKQESQQSNDEVEAPRAKAKSPFSGWDKQSD